MAVNLKGPLSALQVMQDAPVIPVIVIEDEAHADTFMRPSGRPQASARVDAPGEPAPVDVVDPQGLLGPAIIPHRRDAPTEAMLEAAQPPSQLALIPPPKKARERRTYELPPLRLLDYKAPPPIELEEKTERVEPALAHCSGVVC